MNNTNVLAADPHIINLASFLNCLPGAVSSRYTGVAAPTFPVFTSTPVLELRRGMFAPSSSLTRSP